MAGIETLEEFLRDATPAQAAAFAAGCAERASAILFWVVSKDGRANDLEVYEAALSSLWSMEDFTPAEFGKRRQLLTTMDELSVGDEVSGARAFAYQGAVALYTALGAIAGGREGEIRDCSSTLRNFAFRLGRRCGYDLLVEEDKAQRQDIADLTEAGDDQQALLPALRARSATVGRRWLALAVERFA